MKYAIISDSFWNSNNWETFAILKSNLTKEQVNGIIKASEQAQEISNRENKHKMLINVSVEGFDYQMNGEELFNLSYGHIIPMWSFEEFKEEKQ